MDLGDVEVRAVPQSRPQVQRILTPTPNTVQVHNDNSPSITSSISEPTTVVRWSTSPPFPHEYHENSHESLPEHIGVNEATYASTTPLVRLDKQQITNNELEASGNEMMHTVMPSSPSPTDDTPYIRFAIEQLTRDEEVGVGRGSGSVGSYPVDRVAVPEPEVIQKPQSFHLTREELALARKHRSSPSEGRLFNFNATRPLSPGLAEIPRSDSEIFIPVIPPINTPRYPDLTFVPTILRPLSIIMLSLLCLLMIAALIFCAIYSSSHGLEIFDGIYAMYLEGVWMWSVVEGVCWTLIALYVLVLIAIDVVGIWFFRRSTGLIWDPTSLADVIALLPKSNSLKDYPGTDIMTKEEIRKKLRLRSDRLGYWRTPRRAQGVFYCLGEEGASTRRYTLDSGRVSEKSDVDIFQPSDIEHASKLYSSKTRYRYLVWYLRDTFVILWSVAAFVLLLALIVVSFLPSTAIRHGFPPLVQSGPNSKGFSPANFLYSFVPSLLGMLLFLWFQPIDMAFRQLQPWVELSKQEGSSADKSLLLDYTAALPLECTVTALKKGHYRVAVLTMLSLLFIVLPILSGGLFFPLTTSTDEVRMIPNLPTFYILLTLLVLYLLALLFIIPSRHQMHLPHSIDNLAEIISFLHGSGILDDAAFRAPRTKRDMVTRLMAVYTGWSETNYAFGIYRGKHGRECLGIEKLGRRGVEVMV
ncbi:hypothetical protein B7494_g3114 [Chlorociboria aeruginascens]|nr:hypothetical protein B7494_g3114 [Chlorociboria aeruginascens]